MHLPHDFPKIVFNPTDYVELIDPHFHEPKIVLNDTNVFADLEAQGYDTSLFTKRNDN